MYNLSKSVPRGYEYLSSRYFTTKKRKGNIIQDLPPAPYLHEEKKYFNASPIRSKKLLIKARLYKSPLSEREKNTNQLKYDNFFENLTIATVKNNKINNKNLMKKCKENIRKMKTLKD